jgi:hypothetical protein
MAARQEVPVEITLTAPLAAEVLALAKKDRGLAHALAQHLLATIDKARIANFLLGNGVAAALLTERLRSDPDGTLRALAGRPGVRRQGSAGVAAAGRTRQREKSRHRLTADAVQRLKGQVREFLAAHPNASRKAVTEAVQFPSVASYNRLMGELKAAKEVIQRGTRSKSTYSLGGTTKASGAGRTITATSAKQANLTKAALKKNKRRGKRAPRLCPVPGCPNKGAPVFGMMCKDHKGLPKAEQKRLFAERRAATQSPAANSPSE